MSKSKEFLVQAVGKNQDQIDSSNPFKQIGFDGDKKRLGWVIAQPFSKVSDAITKIKDIVAVHDNFVFVGIGGSGNGIKAVISLFDDAPLYTIDSLDPAALEELASKVGSKLEKTLIVPISKSGTTKETQLLSHSLQQLYISSGISDWQKHFLWLSDSPAFEKLDGLGWNGVQKVSIQVDGETDMGGRFSCPGSLIFLLPLYILLGKDLNKLQGIYEHYVQLQESVRDRAFSLANEYKDVRDGFFNVAIADKVKEHFYCWVVQLFQESLGSKINDFYVKTMSVDRGLNVFYDLSLGEDIPQEAVSLMSQMYFYQTFVAYFSAFKGINFVDQNQVEIYKKQMRELEGETVTGIDSLSLEDIVKAAKEKVTDNKKFVEVVLYFHPTKEQLKEVKNSFSAAFPEKEVFVFLGSDWNHHSYQAAATDKNTFFIIMLASNFKQKVDPLADEIIEKNIETLKVIAKATYLTLKDKSLLVACA